MRSFRKTNVLLGIQKSVPQFENRQKCMVLGIVENDSKRRFQQHYFQFSFVEHI